MLRTKVKASSVSNLTDARYFAAWEVDWMGFNLEPGADPAQVVAIKEWIDGPLTTGEFNLQSAEEIREHIQFIGLETVQLGHFSAMETAAYLHDEIPLLKVFHIDLDSRADEIEDHLSNFAPFVQHFLLNFSNHGISWRNLEEKTSLTTDWLADICERYPLILEIDIPVDQLLGILERLQPVGLSLQGGAEEKTGYKSFDELDDIFETLEVVED